MSLLLAVLTVFLNHEGGTFTPGTSDSQANRVSILASTVNVPPWFLPDDDWRGVVDCVGALYERFDVQVVDVDPGPTPHIEVVIGGSPALFGFPPAASGAAAQRCEPAVNDVVLVFASQFQNGDWRGLCETTAQEIGHALGLDHALLCEDPMSYLEGCGAKEFQNEAAPCGEYDDRLCACGGASQNSVQHLLAHLGPRTQPSVRIAAPADGAEVTAGFFVEATATDDEAVVRVELSIDGVVADSLTAPPYVFATDPALAPGRHEVAVTAYDDRSSHRRSVAVTVVPGDGGSGDGDGGIGPACDEPACDDGGDSISGGCRAVGRRDGPAWWLVVALLFAVWSPRRSPAG